MTAIVVRNPRQADGRMIRIPTRADGRYYAYELIFGGGESRAYADTFEELAAALIENYADTAPAPLNQRIRYAFDAQVRIQAAINAQLLDDPSIAVPPEDAEILSRPRGQRIDLTTWSSTIPLVLLATDYAPVGPHPRPDGETIIWIDPVNAESLIRSLADAGYVVLAELDPTVPVEQLGSYQPYNESTMSGIRWSPDQVELWDRGTQVAVSTHTGTSVIDFWSEGLFRSSFPRISHWYGTSAWTGRVKLSLDPGQDDSRVSTVTGTIQCVDDDAPARPWHVEFRDDTTLVHVPLPPFEQGSNTALVWLLTQRILAVVEGRIPSGEWRVMTSIIETDAFDDAFAVVDAGITIVPFGEYDYLDVQELPAMRGVPRQWWLQSLGIA